MHELTKLSGRAVETRDNLGFAAITWDKLPIRLIATLSELDDVERGLNSDITTADTLGFELSDVALYTLTVLEDVFGDAWHVSRLSVFHRVNKHREPAILCSPIRQSVMRAYSAWRKGRRDEVQYNLQEALNCINSLANALDVDLVYYVERRLEENAKRAHLHGGKDPNS